MEEYWLEIDGFDGYWASNLGRIKSYRQSKKGMILKQRLGTKGYCLVMISDNNKKKHFAQVHRLILKTFNPIENMDNMDVNHKDENKTNNCLSNLEWMTHAENVRYGTGSTRAAEPQKMKLRCIETGVIYNSMKEASESLNINYGNLSRHCSGQLETINGLHFEVLDYGSRPHPNVG